MSPHFLQVAHMVFATVELLTCEHKTREIGRSEPAEPRSEHGKTPGEDQRPGHAGEPEKHTQTHSQHIMAIQHRRKHILPRLQHEKHKRRSEGEEGGARGPQAEEGGYRLDKTNRCGQRAGEKAQDRPPRHQRSSAHPEAAQDRAQSGSQAKTAVSRGGGARQARGQAPGG